MTVCSTRVGSGTTEPVSDSKEYLRTSLCLTLSLNEVCRQVLHASLYRSGRRLHSCSTCSALRRDRADKFTLPASETTDFSLFLPCMVDLCSQRTASPSNSPDWTRLANSTLRILCCCCLPFSCFLAFCYLHVKLYHQLSFVPVLLPPSSSAISLYPDVKVRNDLMR